MEYVEKYFPLSDIEDSRHIENLISDVKSRNGFFAREVLSKKGISHLELENAERVVRETEK
jgi:tetrahydromethanopterin S-methyltransferase subunit F